MRDPIVVRCIMLDTDPLLFDPHDLRVPAPNRSLVIRSTKSLPLTKIERAFNAALKKVQALGTRLDDEKHRLDRLLIFHAAEIRPRIERAGQFRAALLQALVAFLDDRRLTAAQRRVLREVALAQLDAVLAYVEQPDANVQAVFERLHGLTYAQALQADIEDVRDGMAGVFDDLGLDIEVPELHPDMTDDDMAAAAARLAEQLGAAEQVHSRRAQSQTKQQRRDEERRRQQEQLRKETLGAVYRRLVKELHPDLEPDPAERDRKNRIIQDITAAYSRRDLHALLRLELQWLEGADDAARMSEDKLRAHTAMLKQQARELESELESLRFHPRYTPLLVDTPWGIPTVVDGPAEVQRLDLEIERIRVGLDRISSNAALDDVRVLIREYRKAERQNARRAPRR
jgi:hypothetical protein